MRIIIESIPHEEQRYPTCGDWFYDQDGTLQIRVSELKDWRHSALVAVHELVECLQCKRDGVSQEVVDKFDKQFEADRAAGLHGPEDEPGDDPSAPYGKQHGIATGVERILAAVMGVSWNQYADEIESLP